MNYLPINCLVFRASFNLSCGAETEFSHAASAYRLDANGYQASILMAIT